MKLPILLLLAFILALGCVQNHPPVSTNDTNTTIDNTSQKDLDLNNSLNDSLTSNTSLTADHQGSHPNINETENNSGSHPVNGTLEDTGVSAEYPTFNSSDVLPRSLSLNSTFAWILDEDHLDAIINTNKQVVDIDAFQTPKSLIDLLHNKNKIVIAYLSVGSAEDWRPDYNSYPRSLIGNTYPDWEDERFVNIKDPQLYPIIRNRLDMIKEKGFDGVEADNIDLHTFNTGFDIDEEDVINFFKWLSNETHSRGLLLCQKNAPELSQQLVNYSDCLLWEDPTDYENLDYGLIYIQNNKPVFAVEYTDTYNSKEFLNRLCPMFRERGYYGLLKNRDLDDFEINCD